MELMGTCAEKLKKRIQGPIPERILGKMTVAVSGSNLRAENCTTISRFLDLLQRICVISDSEGPAVSQRETWRHPPRRQTLQHSLRRERSDQAVRLWHQRAPRGLQGQDP